MNIEELTPKQLESISCTSGYNDVRIRLCTFLGYTKDNHAIYKCIFADFDDTVGNIYVWEKDGTLTMEY